MAKSCDKCKHGNNCYNIIGECIGYDKWEPKEAEMKKTCNDCRYNEDRITHSCHPCNSNYSGWEPKEADMKKNCGYCKHEDLTSDREPCNVCEIVRRGPVSFWEPKETETNLIKEEAMKTQEIFTVVVTENEKIKDDYGQIESIKKRVIFSALDIPAFDENNAKLKAMAAANKVTGAKAIKDLDEVEVKVSRPFQAS